MSNGLFMRAHTSKPLNKLSPNTWQGNRQSHAFSLLLLLLFPVPIGLDSSLHKGSGLLAHQLPLGSALPRCQPRHTPGAHRASAPRGNTLCPSRPSPWYSPPGTAPLRPGRLSSPRPLVEPRPAEAPPRAARSLRKAAASARSRGAPRSYRRTAAARQQARQARPLRCAARPRSRAPLLPAALPKGTSPAPGKLLLVFF